MKENIQEDSELSYLNHRSNVEVEGQSLINESVQKKHKTPQEELDEKKKKIEEWAIYLKDKLIAFIWVAGAVAAVYYSNFFKHLYDHEKTNSLFYSIFMMSVGVNSIIAIYIVVVLPYILKIKEDIEVYNPKVIYIATISGLISFISLIITVWPVFGWYSILLVIVMFVGYVNTNNFLPGNNLGSLLFCMIFVGSFFTHLIIEHDGYLHN
eukprot:TRINITY_DN3328_c0_g1_i2.p1 TRINITY_DN3328_c0_g1~~TRINITY_DN3328_c0_g1_i2.p1  ORF type:complete len:210 (+),score=31.39 TRINITY_DN3328_c0_g1_i2:161-790(+)